jgi:peptidoglycan/xylan/chitin deacetylase (PgdA/CDA1 family)
MAINDRRARLARASQWIDDTLADAIRRMPQLNDPPVFVYHEVGEPLTGAAPAMAISPDRFERHVRWLAGLGYTGITVAEWLTVRRDCSWGPAKPVLITFDDGYEGVGKHALPILREYGFTATVFVVTGRLGRTNDWDSDVTAKSHRLMGADDILRWSKAGVEIGAHTRSHPNLARISASAAIEEIEGSYSDLADLLGSQPTSFAYPYGLYSRTAWETVSRLFEAAFTVDESPNRSSTDLCLLHRSGALPQDSRTDLALRLHMGWTPRHQLVMRARRRTGLVRRRLGLTRR